MRRIVAAVVRFTGIAWLVRNTYARRRAAILVYHDPEPSAFDRHLAHLTRHYAVVPLSLVVDALRGGTWASLPPRPVVVTLDDGHRRNVELVDSLRRHGATATVFACSEIVGTNRGFWFLACGDARSEELKPLPTNERRRILREEIDFDEKREGSAEERVALSREEILASWPYLDVQSHGRFHPVLTVTDPLEAREEIVESKHEIERITGRPCGHFAFPNGDYLARDLELATAAGYSSARTVDHGWVGPESDPMRLPVVSSSADFRTSVTALVGDLCGLERLVGWVKRHASFDGVRYPVTRRRGAD